MTSHKRNVESSYDRTLPCHSQLEEERGEIAPFLLRFISSSGGLFASYEKPRFYIKQFQKFITGLGDRARACRKLTRQLRASRKSQTIHEFMRGNDCWLLQ